MGTYREYSKEDGAGEHPSQPRDIFATDSTAAWLNSIETIGAIETGMPVTSIQVSEETKRELLEYASNLQAKLGRKVSFDDAIRTSLRERKSVEEARQKFDFMYGSLSKESKKEFWRDLENTKKADRIAIEKKASSYS